MATKKKTPDPPKFSDFKDIQVPIAALRRDLASIQKDGTEYMPLSDFLQMVHLLVLEDKEK